MQSWIRLDQRTKIRHVPGKMSTKERDLFQIRDHQKGAYDYFYSAETGRTTVRLTEHPEWP